MVKLEVWDNGVLLELFCLKKKTHSGHSLFCALRFVFSDLWLDGCVTVWMVLVNWVFVFWGLITFKIFVFGAGDFGGREGLCLICELLVVVVNVGIENAGDVLVYD